MVPDIELPVWTIRPNWSEPVIERLSWLTDVIAASYGTEQRRAMRLSPRRDFEMKFNPIDETRSYFQLFLHRLGSSEFMLPLFHDAGRTTAAIAAAAVSIPVDTTYREFEVDGLAILLGDDPFVYDVVTVSAIADGALTVTGVTRAWPKRSTIMPLRRTRLEQESAMQAITNHVADATLRFELNQANDIGDEGEWATVFGDYPVMTTKPNWREAIDLDFERNSLVLDNDQGLRELGDDAGRAFTAQSHMMMMRGRAEHWAFRQLLYRLRGQQGAIWVPSFNRDIVLSQAALAAAVAIDVKKIGYAYTGGVVSGRTYLWFNNGAALEITGVGAPASDAEERLNLGAALGTDMAAGTSASFMDTCRLGSDEIEITHHTDTDGVAECSLLFRSFRDEREIPDPVDFPIPASAIINAPCGEPAPEEASCYVPPDEFIGQIMLDYTAGARIPTMLPFVSWTCYRGGLQIAYIDNSFGFDYEGVPDVEIRNQTFTFTAGHTDYWNDASFAAGVPEEMHLSIQFPFGAFADDVNGFAIATFKLPNQTPVTAIVAPGSDGAGGINISIYRLWPAEYGLLVA